MINENIKFVNSPSIQSKDILNEKINQSLITELDKYYITECKESENTEMLKNIMKTLVIK